LDDLIPNIRNLMKELDELPNEIREVQLAQLYQSQKGASPKSVTEKGSGKHLKSEEGAVASTSNITPQAPLF
jgi:hypothetical protein